MIELEHIHHFDFRSDEPIGRKPEDFFDILFRSCLARLDRESFL